ncbi:glutathione S-transferase family protein [Roseibium litorale]|uniref:Glutathione S-transferase family protein n=1 Tax=Roseibium litorale TaxID=2803841 RepID=A0ABR9CTX2_9HYPH|nr:glutathione S-transferase family protein [Roseibium litorale]MBD8894163.1 glutathione S-transferase family protein [Roseibium litorale]
MAGDIVLWGALNSGHSYKARLYLLLAGVDHAYNRVDLSIPRAERPADFRAVSPYGEVPVLKHGPQVLAQSNAILLHLVRSCGKFGVEDAAGLDQITQWLFWEANRIGRSYPNYRYCRLLDPNVDPGLLGWFEATAKDDLAFMDQVLAEKDFLTGQFSVADISCAAYLLYGDLKRLELGDYAHVEAWLDRIRAMSGWQHPFEVMG